MFEYRQVIYRLKQGQSAREIAKETAFGRNKVNEIRQIAKANGWLIENSPLPEGKELMEFFRKPENIIACSSKVASYSDCIHAWVKEGIKATVIHRHLVEQYDYKGSYNTVQRYIQRLKLAQPPELTVPLSFNVGEAAQVDFGKGPRLYDERLGKEVDTWFFVMTLCWSRHQYAEFVTSQDIETWLGCHQRAFHWFNGVVGKVIIDNPKCAITKACYDDPVVQRSYEEFAQAYGFLISACPPREPKKKGRVEAGVKYIKHNFLPLQQFKSLQDANQKLKAWVKGTAGNRTHGSTHEKPLSQFMAIEQHQLKSLPKSEPEIAVWTKVKLYRDCHIRYQKCLYSAPHSLYGQTLWAKVTSTLVSIYHQHELVASHARQFKSGERQTIHQHLPPNAQYYLTRDTTWCHQQASLIGEHCEFVIEHLLTDPVRDLLRQAQKILSLTETYDPKRLELACQRAIHFKVINLKTIKAILAGGFDDAALSEEESFDSLSAVYCGEAQYQRYLNHTIQ